MTSNTDQFVKNDTVYREVEWDSEKVQRFWDYYSGRPESDQIYFGRMFGDAVIAMAAPHMPSKGLFVDLGCGPGFFSQKLQASYPAANLISIDSSENSIESVRRKCNVSGTLLETKEGEVFDIPIEDATVDVLFLLEVIEHLDDALIARTLQEVRRVLKPGGLFVLTTPNNENLEQGKVACPECGCVFHRMQHQQSFSAERIDRLLMHYGLQPAKTRTCNLGLYQGGTTKRALRKFKNTMTRNRISAPHLVSFSVANSS